MPKVVGSGGRSNFSQMCTILSQYLKENGGFGDLKLGLNPKAEKTMDLFPIVEKSGQGSGSGNPPSFSPNLAASKYSYLSGPETAQMTIFYGGKVMIYDDEDFDPRSGDPIRIGLSDSSPGGRAAVDPGG